MEKSILIFLSILTFACQNQNKEGKSNLKKISESEWNKRGLPDKKDSILFISIYKETINYVLYWVKFNKKPYPISREVKNCIELVDYNTIFGNRCKKVSTNYEVLLKKNMISFPLDTKSIIDDSLEGHMYVFKIFNKEDFRKIQIVKYFELLENVIPNKAMSLEEEVVFFDKVSALLWDGNVSN